jgi:hypothetical protein
MAECSFHPGTETNVRCVECDRYICPKDMVPTPVGYKCKECAKQLPSARRTVKPRQLVAALIAADVIGIGGAFLIAVTGMRFWLVGLLLGVLTGEAARRASGGHRTGSIAAAAGISVILGALIFNLGYLTMVLGAGAAVVYVMQNRW